MQEAAGALLEMTGLVERITFRNERNGYTVLELSAGGALLTVVGTMPLAEPGGQIHVWGHWTEHPSFGRQFAAETYALIQPKTAQAILQYLSSGSVKGIGRATARRLVEAFGEETLSVLEKEPERLSQIPGISREKALRISEAYSRKAGIREAMLALSSFGITSQEAMRVYEAFGASAADRVRADPYCLCREGLSFSFQRADAIAASMERPADDAARVRAGLLYVLRHNLENGHTCLPEQKLLAVAAQMLGVEKARAEEEGKALLQAGELKRCEIRGRAFCYLPRLYNAEVFSASRLQMMLDFPCQPISGAEQALQAREKAQGVTYAPEQREAILAALLNGMVILTGGPCTGKTTTLDAILHILEQKGEKVLLAAPTGRAAKRMSELTGQEAKTLHRLLQAEWDANDEPAFARNEHHPLECDALVIDELSMVDALLFEAVLRALPMGCRLILVGDRDQLPSVGAGSVLGDLIASGMLPVVELKHVFRQSRQSRIVTNAHRIIAGEMPVLNDTKGDFFFLQRSEPQDIAQTILDLCEKRLPKSYGFSPMTDIQVLAPGRKGELGTLELNRKLQSRLNPTQKDKPSCKIGGRVFRVGDKVMQTKNDYTLSWEKADGTMGEGVYNGDIGVLEEIDRAAGLLLVDLDGKHVTYGPEEAEELELAYAMTVHKSQGSEFPAVVMPMYPGPRPLYYRNLFYTAVTRARRLLVLVGTQKTVHLMVENGSRAQRYTGLAAFLTGEVVTDGEA